jgi:hypothetical protein
MDIKRNRREASNRCRDDYPGPLAQGSAASDENHNWFLRAQSWQMGANVFSYADIERENDQEHARWGTPYRDVPSPAGGIADDPLPDPHNFHSNPGYMATSTASALQASQPGSVYRVPGPGSPNVGHRPMPVGGRPQRPVAGRTVAPGSSQADSRSEGSPLVVSTGTER